MTNAEPNHHQNQHQHDRKPPQLPLRKTVVMSALIKCLAVQVFAHPGVIAQRLAQRVLHSLGWLGEVGIHIAIVQKLNKFG
ncbi:Uncharacterised protein [Salmonella enterica subsp. enterica serovar Bovismorbificans]|uniref:Uncharacterized protein n=1 Tax=Salmonella enterica subsp. enterica serovar Bovismorbificans TaxID=58097 RepID=A0A655DME4_SALET|nr:Uncharacterised protein [Salmonella enterica subsp. enterica serovar Bovismorbificans]CNU76556.1 Uncharacterised protein [Salmonella enterica subsp. enterica serovar Bovismorbificans]CNU86164.1 Uncharacterised protein [Salmonella enterica subsp. enterica serovar Bovismorbificans]CNU94459.1 Uncharacterised protein [Salmonella enterica subsp. enterica serovar Bovismorbificans]